MNSSCKSQMIETLYAALMNSIIAEIPVLNRVPSISSVTYESKTAHKISVKKTKDNEHHIM